ncbi:MAG TPA: gliding motility-associated C-terminal domain-containing protein, partial [Bacteroidia bacterium]|nr:gliding motility-associated C-terminal domain-containing protein [Bacteroidia bacterium]
TVSVTANTSYTVTVTDANGCTTSGTASVNIAPAPTASFTSNASNGFFNIANGVTQLCFTDASSGATSWNWDLNGTGTSSQQSPCVTVTSADSGQYCAQLIVQNLFGCQDTSDVCITIGESFFSIPNIFTPNGDGTNDVFLVTNSGLKSLQCSIYDRWGALVYKWDGVNGGWDGKSTSGNEAVDGVYYYTILIVDYAEKQYEEKGFVHLIRGTK